MKSRYLRNKEKSQRFAEPTPYPGVDGKEGSKVMVSALNQFVGAGKHPENTGFSQSAILTYSADRL